MTITGSLSIGVVRIALLQFMEMHQQRGGDDEHDDDDDDDNTLSYADDIERLKRVMEQEPEADFVKGLYEFCKDPRWNELVDGMLEMDEALTNMWSATKENLINSVDNENNDSINSVQHREKFLMQIDDNMKDIRKRVQNHYNEFYW